MRIIETLTPINADKVFVGDRNITLTLDTETGRIGIRTPAMFATPTVTMEELQKALDDLWARGNPG